MKSKNVLKQQEMELYKLQDEFYYNGTNKKEIWDKMFFMVLEAVTYAIKKKLIGIVRNDIDDLALDATCQIMNRYNKSDGYRIKYLLTTANYAAIGVLYNQKQIFLDRTSFISFESWQSWQLANEKN